MSLYLEPGAALAEGQVNKDRIPLLDVLRGLAVLGIYWINIVVFFLDSDVFIETTSKLGLNEPGILSGLFTEVFIEGTMIGLFSVLFGASALVFLNETKLTAHGVEVVERYYRRTMLLMVFGMVHGYVLLWPHDVLYVYGVLGLFLFPLRKVATRMLLLLGVLLLVLGDVNLLPLTDQLQGTEEKTGATPRQITKQAPDQVQLQDPSGLVVTIEGQPHTYMQKFRRNVSDVMYEQSARIYTEYVFSVGGMMLIGMSLLRWGVLSAARSRRFYLALAFAGYVAGILVHDVDFFSYLFNELPVLQGEHTSLLGYNAGRFLMILGHIGAVGFLVSSGWLSAITRLLAAVGRLALTNYVLQTVISLFVFHFFAFELLTGFNRDNLVYICVLVWTFQATFSLVWLRFFKLGPLEWVWRSLIYGRRQPLRIGNRAGKTGVSASGVAA